MAHDSGGFVAGRWCDNTIRAMGSELVWKITWRYPNRDWEFKDIHPHYINADHQHCVDCSG